MAEQNEGRSHMPGDIGSGLLPESGNGLHLTGISQVPAALSGGSGFAHFARPVEWSSLLPRHRSMTLKLAAAWLPNAQSPSPQAPTGVPVGTFRGGRMLGSHPVSHFEHAGHHVWGQRVTLVALIRLGRLAGGRRAARRSVTVDSVDHLRPYPPAAACAGISSFLLPPQNPCPPLDTRITAG